MSLLAYQRAVMRVTFGLEASASDLALLGDEARWRMYREMVRGRLEGMAAVAFKQTRELLGEAAFKASFARFLAWQGAQSPLIREVIAAFGGFAEHDAHLLDGGPQHAPDLLRFELAKWEVAYLPAHYPAFGEQDLREFDFEGRAVLNPVLRRLSLLRAVLPECGLKSAPGESSRFSLLVYRPAGIDEVRWWAVSEFFSSLIEHFGRAEQSVAEAVRTVADLQQRSVDVELLETLATDLTLAVQRGLVLGVRGTPAGS